ncbi:hypothetical protein BDW74DRAFT_151724 [Aspergillus multicolor]|uniref:uncharacterized protein n=1 Tax=Aspergillus multicolor TaxID=41759 RepID=UPI003CCD7015
MVPSAVGDRSFFVISAAGVFVVFADTNVEVGTAAVVNLLADADSVVVFHEVCPSLSPSGHASREHGSTEQQPRNPLEQVYQIVPFEHCILAISNSANATAMSSKQAKKRASQLKECSTHEASSTQVQY